MKKIILIISAFLFSFYANAQHTLVLKSGEKMNGEVKKLEDGKITFIFKGNAMTFNVTDVEQIMFTKKAAEAEAKPAEQTTGMKGVSFEMAGRQLVKPPKAENLTMKKGIVVVAITIDKYGHIMKADAGAEGTTTSDDYLLKLAKHGAESAMFDNCPKCPLEMKGTITLTF
jgi:hypothetical protein